MISMFAHYHSFSSLLFQTKMEQQLYFLFCHLKKNDGLIFSVVWDLFTRVLGPGLTLHNAYLGSRLHGNTYQWLQLGHINLETNVFLSLLFLPSLQ
jgi:hypothetical protein